MDEADQADLRPPSQQVVEVEYRVYPRTMWWWLWFSDLTDALTALDATRLAQECVPEDRYALDSSRCIHHGWRYQLELCYTLQVPEQPDEATVIKYFGAFADAMAELFQARVLFDGEPLAPADRQGG